MEQKITQTQQKDHTQNEQPSNDDQGLQSLTKRRKLDTEVETMNKLTTQQLKERFDAQQIPRLLSGLKMIEEYYKMVSIEIKHQEDSISTLRPALLERFPELASRKQQMIEKGKENIKFIKSLLMPYKELLAEDMLKQKLKQNFIKGATESVGHSHSHGHRSYQTIVNLFYEVALEWGNQSQIHYVKRTIELLEKYFIFDNSHQSQVSQTQRTNILVVGCGMGRILSEILDKFKSRGTNVLLQGHANELQHYICSQYFLNNSPKPAAIFPYIHNFSNYLNQSAPYRQIFVPFGLQQSSYYYPLTWGKFLQLYKTHQDQWQCLVTVYHNYHINDVLLYIKMVYKMLAPGAIWIDLCTCNFSSNLVMMSYKEYENILEKSQFQLLEKGCSSDYWYEDKECIMNQKRTTYYRVMRK